VAKALIGVDSALYTDVVADESLTVLHLIPLQRKPNDAWVEMALVALGRYTPQEVAAACWSAQPGDGLLVAFGSESSMWQEWLDAFRGLGAHDDERIREIGRIGVKVAQHYYDAAVEEEIRVAVLGWD
jgi:hypothetical protein